MTSWSSTRKNVGSVDGTAEAPQRSVRKHCEALQPGTRHQLLKYVEMWLPMSRSAGPDALRALEALERSACARVVHAPSSAHALSLQRAKM
jgi:hypothetical protein